MTSITLNPALPLKESLKPRSRSPFVKKFLANKGAVIGATVLILFILAAILAPWIAPYDPLKANFLAVRKAPSMMHWLGTDELGRDLFSRLLWGARSSLLAGGVSVAIAMVIGVPLGLLAGYFGGKLDAVISRIMEALLSCPFLVLAIALGAFLGPSLSNAMIAIGLSAMPIFSRLTRGQVLAIRHEDYLEGARAIGLPDRWIILRYASAILAEASLSFLGLGQQPPSPSWGSMLNTAKNFMEQAPWMSIAPGVAIYITVLCFNLLGDGLRDALDPKS
jgi:peptide/nickel transport system permease protein